MNTTSPNYGGACPTGESSPLAKGESRLQPNPPDPLPCAWGASPSGASNHTFPPTVNRLRRRNPSHGTATGERFPAGSRAVADRYGRRPASGVRYTTSGSLGGKRLVRTSNAYPSNLPRSPAPIITKPGRNPELTRPSGGLDVREFLPNLKQYHFREVSFNKKGCSLPRFR